MIYTIYAEEICYCIDSIKVEHVGQLSVATKRGNREF